MPYQPNLNFTLSDGRDLGSLGWITKEYLMTVYPQIAGQLITPELWTWGGNGYGQLGDNTSTQRNTPVTTFAGGTNWKQVAAGDAVTSGIKTDGTLWTWGQNFFALLGNNSSSNSLTPVTTFAGGTNWKQIAVSNNAIAIKTDGTLWTWGRNAYGEQGINSSGGRSTPVTTFAGGTNWKQVDSSRVFTIAIRTSDDLQGI